MKKKILLMSPSMFVIMTFAVVPILIMIYFSFMTSGATGNFTLEHYRNFFSKGFYLNLTFDTIRMSFLVTLICLIIGYPAAYFMSKFVKSGKNLILILIIIPLWTSQLVRAYSWLTLLQDGGVLESFLRKLNLIGASNLGILFTEKAVIIALVHIFLPFMIVTIFMSLEKLDDSLLEASKSLGAKPVTTFFKVIFPLSRTGVISGSILVFVPCLGVFVEPRILGGTNGSVIGTIIEDQFFEIYGWNFGAAIAVILLLIVLISMSLLSRFNREEV